MVTFVDLRIARDGIDRLGPVSLSLDPGRRTLILGHNGAGKSLLLRAAHGLLEPDTGSVAWAGQTPSASRASRGFVFQSTPVMRRSVAQNIDFPLVARGVPARERRSRVGAIMELAQLADWADNPAATLSGGEKQRLALARALVTNPSTILLDEPAASLDPAATQLLEQLILRAHADGTGIIMSTHDLGQAARLAQDVVLLDQGKVALQAGASAFFAENAPDPAMDYRAGRLRSNP